MLAKLFLMMSLVLFLFPVRVQAQVRVERQGYSIVGGNKVVIDSKEQWSFWKAAAKTIQVTDEGVRPGFMRKSTEIEIDGQMVRVPGIDVVPNAFEFGGGIKAAGSKRFNRRRPYGWPHGHLLGTGYG